MGGLSGIQIVTLIGLLMSFEMNANAQRAVKNCFDMAPFYALKKQTNAQRPMDGLLALFPHGEVPADYSVRSNLQLDFEALELLRIAQESKRPSDLIEFLTRIFGTRSVIKSYTNYLPSLGFGRDAFSGLRQNYVVDGKTYKTFSLRGVSIPNILSGRKEQAEVQFNLFGSDQDEYQTFDANKVFQGHEMRVSGISINAEKIVITVEHNVHQIRKRVDVTEIQKLELFLGPFDFVSGIQVVNYSSSAEKPVHNNLKKVGAIL